MLKIFKLIPIQSRWIISLVLGVHLFALFGAFNEQPISSSKFPADILSIAIVRNASVHDSMNSDQKSDFIQTARIGISHDPSPARALGSTGIDLSPPRPLPNLSERNIHSNPKPPYPLASKRLGEQGAVKLSLCIDRLGTVEIVSMVNSSGYEKLDRSALETVRTWKFAAIEIEDQSLSHCYLLPIHFRLEA